MALAALLAGFLPPVVGSPDPSSVAGLASPSGPAPLDAIVTATMAASRTSALPKDTVVFTITILNSGDAAAPRVWINETLPASIAYVSDTAASAGSTTPFPAFTFSSVGIGSRSFQVTTRVAIGTAPGTWATNSASVTYADTANAVHAAPAAQATVVLGLVRKQLHLTTTFGLTPIAPTGSLVAPGIALKRGSPPLTWDLSPVLALPFQANAVSAVLYLDSPSGSSQTFVLNATVWDRNGATFAYVASVQQTLVSDSLSGYQRFSLAIPLAANVTFAASHQVRLSLQVLNSGSTDDAVLAMYATSVDSLLDLLTPTYVSVTVLALRDANGAASVWSPKDSLVVQATVSDPFGSYDILGARVNITNPSGSLVVAYAVMALLQTDPANPSRWKVFEATLAAPLANGTYSVEVVGIEGNAVVDVASGSATVRAPRFVLTKTADVAQARQNTRFTYTVWFNNTGTAAAAQVWINDTMPSQVTWQGSPNATAVPNTPIWVFTNVGVGAHWVTFDVRVSGSVVGVAFILNTVSLNYSDEKGYLWPMEIATRDVIINGPVISLAVVSSPAAFVHANETVAETITLTNTGDAAQTIWLNVSLPAGLSYISDTHNPAWGSVSVAGGAVDFLFSNMPAGAPTQVWAFTLTLRAGAALPRGSVQLVTAGLNDTSTNGILMPPRAAAVSLTASSPWIPAAGLAISSGAAVPGDRLTISASGTNQGNEAARTVWINLTLDPDLLFVDASVPAAPSVGNVRLTVSGLPVGAWAVYLNVSVNLSVSEGRVLAASGSLEYEDGVGNPLPPLALSQVSATVHLPRFLLSVTPGTTTLEAGTTMALAVSLTNAGSGTARDVWLNLSLPGSLQYVSDTSDGTRSVVGPSYSWHWSGFAPQTDLFSLTLAASPSVAHGTNLTQSLRVEGTDGNGNPQAPATASVRVTFLAPRIVLTLSQSAEEPPAGSTISYSIQVRNEGSSTARYVNVTDLLDEHVEFVDFVASVGATDSGPLSWNFTDLAPGGSQDITVLVHLKEGTPSQSVVPNTVEARYSNSVGRPIGYQRFGTYLTVAPDLSAILYILVGGFALGSLVVLIVYRRSRERIEEVFLVYRDGILISHLSRTMVEENDRDVLSGMLTAVQEFVKDAFRYGEHRELHQMEFGDYHILIERGAHVYLAVVYRGRDSALIRKRVRVALDSVESSYGRVLETWDGAMETVVGTRDVLRERLLTQHFPWSRSRAG